MVPESDKTNFETLLRAAKGNSLCLLKATRKSDNKQVSLICAINVVEGKYEMVPLAIMNDDNPYEIFIPPVAQEKRFQPVPKHWPKRFNACSDACDAIRGPCACGAWHELDEDWVRDFTIIYGIKPSSTEIPQ